MRPSLGTEPDFTVIPQPRLRGLAERGLLRRYRKNTVVMEEGDRGDLLLIVLAGRLRAYSVSQHNDRQMSREVTYGVYGAGDLVGIQNFPNVTRVLEAFLARPAVAKGLEIPARS